MSEVSQEIGEKWGKVKVPGKVFGKTPIEFDPEGTKEDGNPSRGEGAIPQRGNEAFRGTDRRRGHYSFWLPWRAHVALPR